MNNRTRKLTCNRCGKKLSSDYKTVHLIDYAYGNKDLHFCPECYAARKAERHSCYHCGGQLPMDYSTVSITGADNFSRRVHVCHECKDKLFRWISNQ